MSYKYFIVLLFIITGCTRVNLVGQGEIQSGTSIKRGYEINTEYTAYIGQSFLKWYDMNNISNTITANSNFTLNGTYKKKVFIPKKINLNISSDKVYKIVGKFTVNLGKYNIIDVQDNDDNTYGLLLDDAGNIVIDYIADADHDEYFVASKVDLSPSGAKFIADVKSFKSVEMSHELVFGGINDVGFNVSYREYSSANLARQAFYQNLTYPTSSDIIRFQNFKIKIVEVTNEKIVYSVIEDGL